MPEEHKPYPGKRLARLAWKKVTQTTIYLVDMDDFARVNEVYAGFFYRAISCPELCVRSSSLTGMSRLKLKSSPNWI